MTHMSLAVRKVEVSAPSTALKLGTVTVGACCTEVVPRAGWLDISTPGLLPVASTATACDPTTAAVGVGAGVAADPACVATCRRTRPAQCFNSSLPRATIPFMRSSVVRTRQLLRANRPLPGSP